MSPPEQKKHSPFPEKSRSASTNADKKEGGAGMALPPCKVLLRSDAGTGPQKVAIYEATLSVTTAKGWMCDTFLGNSMKQVNPMCQRLQNAAPPRIGSAIFRQILRVFYPRSRRRRWIRSGLVFGAPFSGIQS